MPQEYTNRELSIMLSNIEEKFTETKDYLAGVIKDSINGTHRRLDTLNHAVAKNVDKIEHNKEYISLHEGINKINCEKISALWDDRENKIKRYGDLIWKVITTAVLIFFGVNAF